MENNIKLIYQRLLQLRALIQRFKDHSTEAENCLASEIFCLEIKRIDAVQLLEKKLGKLKALIPVYKAQFPAYEHLLADQIIIIDLQIIAAKSNHPSSHPSSPPPAAPQLSVQQPPIPQSYQPIQSNNMAKNFNGRPQQIPNLYWQQGQPVGAPVKSFRQIKYLPLPNAVPNLDQALSKARFDCANHLHKQLIDYGGAAKVWMTLLWSMSRFIPWQIRCPLNSTIELHRLASFDEINSFRFRKSVCRLRSDPHRSNQGFQCKIHSRQIGPPTR